MNCELLKLCSQLCKICAVQCAANAGDPCCAGAKESLEAAAIDCDQCAAEMEGKPNAVAPTLPQGFDILAFIQALMALILQLFKTPKP